MQVKTSELIGNALDWAVAKCEGHHINMEKGTYGYGKAILYNSSLEDYLFVPSKNWEQGGPIIERENINVGRTPSWADGSLSLSSYWCAYQPATLDDDDAPDATRGDTPLIAAMRCYVVSKLGDTVDIPEELL